MRKVSILGGGLAGLSLGVHLRRLGVETDLYEAGQYPKHKVCGEFICGVSEDALREMGVENIMKDSIHHQKMSWWMGDSLVLEDQLPQVAWGLSRYKLDQDLADKFQSLGGKLHTGQRISSNNLDTEGLVYAVGKSKKTKSQKPWIGLKIHAVNVPEKFIHGLEMHAGTFGYMGLCRVEDDRVNCCGLFQVDKLLKGSGIDLILAYLENNGLRGLANRLRSSNTDVSSFSAIAGFSLGGQARMGDFCIGDSAYLIPPFTGNGMSMALESSHIAGPWLRKFALGEIGWQDCCTAYRSECDHYFKKRMSLSQKMHPLLFNPLGRSALKLSARAGILPFDFLFQQLRTP
ncbi:MAG: NAD(P)/FAD-dependent oxidoreductase [Akkermansiaceae bacterium]